jgi:hypothetical protein
LGEGLNLYAYVFNNPLNSMDPLGNCAVQKLWNKFWYEWFFDISNFIAGYGDTVTSLFGLTYRFGVPSLTGWIRGMWNDTFWGFDPVNYNSGAYAAGRYTAYAWGVVTAAAVVGAYGPAAIAQAARAAGWAMAQLARAAGCLPPANSFWGGVLGGEVGGGLMGAVGGYMEGGPQGAVLGGMVGVGTGGFGGVVGGLASFLGTKMLGPAVGTVAGYIAGTAAGVPSSPSSLGEPERRQSVKLPVFPFDTGQYRRRPMPPAPRP